ncbi:MAG TPA: hypothetical protein DDW27_17750 [Bacteroidales bacterium]|nr:hypothetical protein [Bacteroidales bacterium]
MELFGEFRQKMGIYILDRKGARSKRKVQYTNIESIKKIGIVWDASNNEEFSILSKFHHKMNDKDIKVKIIGFYAGRDLPNNLTAIKYFSCIRKPELDFFYKPIFSVEAATFIKTRFDVLIDINFDKKFPLYYVSTLSTANFKVGLWDSRNRNPIFDLMIELQRPVRIEKYLEHVMYYLEMIKSESPETVQK